MTLFGQEARGAAVAPDAAELRDRTNWSSGMPVVRNSVVGAHAELNKRGLKKAKKPIQQEDRYLVDAEFMDWIRAAFDAAG